MPSSAARPRPSTYDRLVTAAAARFAAFEPRKVTLEEIAADAGVHRVTLHRTFPGGREELMLATLQREVEATLSEVTAVVAEAATAREALSGAVDLLLRRIAANSTLAYVVADPGLRAVVISPTGSAFRMLGIEVWRTVRARAEAEGLRVIDAKDDEVIDYVMRLGLSVLAEPGELTTPRRVRAYVDRFLVATLLPE